MKKCTICGIEKELSEFYKKCDSKDGLTKKCSACCRKWNKDNSEKIKKTAAAYYQKYKEEYKEYRDRYRIEKNEQIKEKRAAKAEASKPYFKEYRQKNREKINEFIKKYGIYVVRTQVTEQINYRVMNNKLSQAEKDPKIYQENITCENIKEVVHLEKEPYRNGNAAGVSFPNTCSRFGSWIIL